MEGNPGSKAVCLIACFESSVLTMLWKTKLWTLHMMDPCFGLVLLSRYWGCVKLQSWIQIREDSA